MTGILEQLHATVEALGARVAALEARPAAGAAAVGAATSGLSLGGTPTPTPTPAVAVTGEQIMELVQKLVANDTAKAALQAWLAANGLAELNMLPPERYSEFYGHAKAIEAQHFGAATGGLGGGLSLGGTPTPAASSNII